MDLLISLSIMAAVALVVALFAIWAHYKFDFVAEIVGR